MTRDHAAAEEEEAEAELRVSPESKSASSSIKTTSGKKKRKGKKTVQTGEKNNRAVEFYLILETIRVLLNTINPIN